MIDKTPAQKRLDRIYADLGKKLERNSQCKTCGRYFHYLGLASHRSSCYEKKKQLEAKDESKP